MLNISHDLSNSQKSSCSMDMTACDKPTSLRSKRRPPREVEAARAARPAADVLSTGGKNGAVVRKRYRFGGRSCTCATTMRNR
eukprot:2009528-Pyramimonas_sp.AAC.1